MRDNHAMPRTPFRTWALDRLGDLAGRSIPTMSQDDIEVARAALSPQRQPVTWVTGRVRRDVVIGSTQVETRDRWTMPVRTYRVAGRDHEALPVLLFIHGGGWVLGNVVNYDPLFTHLAASVPAAVLAPEYRLAPEHHAPVAIHDCIDALASILGGRPAGCGSLDVSRTAVAGDSAGGNLAAVLAQHARDVGTPVSAQALLYPAVDASCLYRSKADHARGPILTRLEGDVFFRHYVGAGPHALRSDDPLVSPIHGRLDGLPPTLVQTAGLDLLRDEGMAYADRLREANLADGRADVEVTSTTYPNAPHGFANFPGASKGAWPHRGELVDFLRRHLGETA